MLASQLAIPNCPIQSGIELEDHQPSYSQHILVLPAGRPEVMFCFEMKAETAKRRRDVMLEDTFPEVDALEEVLQVWFSPVEEMSATRIAAMKFLDEAEAVKSREVKSSPKEM
ncbi:hypothetical protein T06_4838 [Trichinella sp. T6]|nr:hypothetical protein T06_4838 [Trichinella sp. T6]